jgi:hypothetical protein
MPEEPTTLIDVTALKGYFDISKDIKDGRLTPHIGAASRRLKQWVGALVYADALSAETTDALRKADLQFAEASLAMHYAIPGLNSKITPSGVVKSAKEGGAMAGNVVFSYLTPREITELAQIYLDQAEEIARPYMLTDGTPAAELTIAAL